MWGICVCSCPQKPATGFETLGAGVTGICKLPSVNAIGSKPQPSGRAVTISRLSSPIKAHKKICSCVFVKFHILKNVFSYLEFVLALVPFYTRFTRSYR